MISIILAAGSGVRMRPLSYYIPKILLPVRGKPVLSHLLTNLESLEIAKHYVVASNFLEVIDDYLNQAGVHNVEVIRGLGWETGGDLAIALEQVSRDEDAIVMNGDLITDFRVSELVDFHRTTGGLATISTFGLADESEARRFGRVQVDSGGRVTSFEEKGRQNSNPESLVNIGFYLFDRRLIRARQKYFVPRKFRLETELFPRLVREGCLYAYKAQVGYWWDVGTLDSYMKAEEYLTTRGGVIPP